MRITVSGIVSYAPGEIIRIEAAYRNSADWITATRLENLTSGATADFGVFGASTPYVEFNPPIIARITRATQVGANTELQADAVTNEVFLSYHHLDRDLAGRVARALEREGLRVFRAHDDIEVSAEWRPEIRSHLASSALLLALVTSHYVSAAWPNQEAGYSIGRNKDTAAIIVDGISVPGVLGDYQGIPFSTADEAGSVARLVDELREDFPSLFEGRSA